MPWLSRFLVALILVAAWGHLLASRGFAQTSSTQEPTPAESAEKVRSLLSQAQLAVINGSEAELFLSQAQATYNSDLRATLEKDVPQDAQQIAAAFTQAYAALSAGNGPQFASAQAEIWTWLLHASYNKLENAVKAGDVADARRWLSLREFRQATRFSRPDADATLAVASFADGKLTADATLQAVHADLLDTYQARMEDALRTVPNVYRQNFAVRFAQQTSLASGYFDILSDQYAAQERATNLAIVQTAYTALKQAGVEGKDPTAAIAGVQDALKGFRAAPLTDDEQARRAGQMLRYLSLVPIEYGRGVADGKVLKDIEVQEAITFQAGATAALADLLTILQKLDPARTTEVQSLMTEQTARLDATGKGTVVAATLDVEVANTQITTLLSEIMPEAWNKASPSADLDVIASVLDRMESAVVGGDYPQAESARLEAYAILESGPEARLRVFAPQLALQIEDLFWYGSDNQRGLAYLIANHIPSKQVKGTRALLDTRLDEAIEVVKGSNSPVAVATNAGIIVFREGLEAVLILASLLGSLKSGANRKFRKPIWWGVVASFVATVLTFMLARGVLASLARFGEALEAVVSLVAIAVLLLITNWFFHKVYWTGWIAGFHTKKKSLISGEMGQMLGLVILGFTSVYREGFETVLFLQALVLEAGMSSVLTGIAIGLAGTILVGVVVLALQAKLPYKKMLVATGMMIGIVLLVMVGTTTHVMQLIGWLPAHSIGTIEFPFWVGTWLGTYPTWEGILLQISAGTFVIGSYFLAERRRDHKADSAYARTTTPANHPAEERIPVHH